ASGGSGRVRWPGAVAVSRARFGFAAHPDALADLRALPPEIRDLTLVGLQVLVHGEGDCLPLTGPLAGFQKVYVDPEAQWRMVVQFRDAPPRSAYSREVFLVAVGPRRGYTVYRDAQLRLGRSNPIDQPSPDQVAAARARSPYAVRTQGAVEPAHLPAPPVPLRRAVL
ncbi:type II toxin-antitoxin system RelE family toxin, partial [Streptomyces acidiscabies]|uniref:type II toxin-antitoxin system RelE family toxin n=4 Tax=Streptomyces acidiscabies TaxID=42234 RepID=UPI000AEF0A3D